MSILGSQCFGLLRRGDLALGEGRDPLLWVRDELRVRVVSLSRDKYLADPEVAEVDFILYEPSSSTLSLYVGNNVDDWLLGSVESENGVKWKKGISMALVRTDTTVSPASIAYRMNVLI